ncbi:MAG: UDP-N-acetylmuramate dehydrogenase [Candidatus Koribacter versatilis]|uniref:UDP-N-acetylenolpyruvoylglucosamine reductase n=1 Tax=Candidatus Korobacter versatilis TaxID=658062 RepID=A0A932A840_9BACT|nr:UDP-N-acetylmuramate dehydrogenase [Candidatus Koribacter versatilis]
MNIAENIPLAPLTTFRVGGAARWFAEARSAEEVLRAVDTARANNWRLFVLGGGSNLVVADTGFHGLVLRIAITGIDDKMEDGKRVFEAGAGEDWDKLVAHAVARDCAGVECLSGIPGTVGGTPVQNVGAYGQEVADTISAVQVFDMQRGVVRDICAEACGFGYRTSIFNTSERGRFIVLKVSYALRPGGVPTLEYADLKKHFAGSDGTPTLAAVRDAVRQIRHSKAMVIVEGDPDCRSAGSFFKNPIVDGATDARIQQVATERGLTPPRFATPEGTKLSAAWLVEQSGFHKGYTRGAVGLSSKHTLAIVNRGGAKATEIVALKDEIQQRVHGTWGIDLHPEPVFVGFDDAP